MIKPLARLIVALAGLALAALPAGAQSAAQVRVTPAQVQVPQGRTAQVAVEVVDVRALYGFDVSLKFDPAAVEVVDPANPQGEPKAALGSFLDSGFVVVNKVDNAAGTVRFAMTQLNPSKPKDGSGVLIVLTLRGKQVGATSPLTLVKVDMADRTGKTFSGALAPGQVSVVAASQAAPAATPFPTHSAETAMPAQTSAPAAAAATAIPTQAPAPTAAQSAPGSADSGTPIGLLLGACGVGFVILGAGIVLLIVSAQRRARAGK